MEDKKVLINSKLKINRKFIGILSQTLLKFIAKPFSFQDKASRFQQN